ncbi:MULTISPECIES: hypothetical protein [Treponema]|uniref:Uncharacterized protein n=1 Tax=Treponema denticola (strain ATCC 35405 / DSM 14222 / CIP 103919 / JCM 8153 / KCTC 15104) TaxID=243275 RepID=Q73P84_TREDE|nr:MULTISPECIES: hypothetical protein [Treponema]AAS11406.1 hypothetical protein TDE_0915 [Treponema denticola ATCC 35405]HCY94032.1 hypothetical protein [Treponema sp.]
MAENKGGGKSISRIIFFNYDIMINFSDIIKAKKMPLCHKQYLCDKREDCLERALQAL